MFSPVDGSVRFPELEREVGRFWKERGIYEKSLAQRVGTPPFVFYEGPPTANGMPHPGHCLTRAIKDLFPRYKTMRGYRCERKAGWDTHGLPVEVEVCKELGIHTKEEIEQYGVERFIAKCQQSVWRYMQEWERLTERLGFWVDLKQAYVTYHQSYVESVWWSLKNIFDRGLLYQGHKIVWWWAQGGTALSAGEVGLGYREVADPSVYVKFPIVIGERAKQLGLSENTSLLVWTTTPWTLPGNQFAAVHPDLVYAVVEDDQTGDRLIAAADLVGALSERRRNTLRTELTLNGSELVGLRYHPPFTYYYDRPLGTGFAGDLHDPNKNGETLDRAKEVFEAWEHEFKQGGPCDWLRAWRIVAADFVTTESGTGAVHIAPAFGEADYEILLDHQRRTYPGTLTPLIINPVESDGSFSTDVPDYEGRWVKECDKDIIRDLKQRGLLYHQEQYVHEYPFCWRAEQDPLIQYPRESWFIRTTQFKEEMLANNAQINWLPEHIKTGRFGKFLESNVDWALSRERYWGTPLPIWRCSDTGQMEALASYGELLAKPGVRGTEVWEEAKRAHPELPDDLKVHKPYIDAVTYDSPFSPDGRMGRVSEVIDCWYDSGAMPFAQWGFPSQPGSNEQFESQFPADFISEAIDQTRGWFYSQLAISTMLFGIRNAEGGKRNEENPIPHSAFRVPHSYPHPFRNCIVLGLMLGEDGQKMAKSKRNYREPNEIFDRYGADALRWYFFASQPPWTTIRYSEQAIKDSIPEFLLRLWNVYSFFVIYANIDGFQPEGSGAGGQGSGKNVAGRSEIDRWILSELNRTCAAVVERMDAYDNYGACQHITEFVDALSNWYVRRSRDRFWMADKNAPEKLDAYNTLYECLLTTCKLIAPFTPFIADAMWRNLAGGARSAERGASKLASSPLAPHSSSLPESVHLADYPTGDASLVDKALSERMNLVREIASLGRNARNAASLKVRQPLAKVEVVLADTRHQAWLEAHVDLIAEELNVKQVDFTTHGEQYISYSVVPNFKRLGPRLGKNLPQVKQQLGKADGAALLSELKSTGKIELKLPDGETIALDNEDIEVRLQAKEGWAAAQGKGCVVVLSTELTPELVAEGLTRDLVRVIQDRRKEMGCEFTDRIEVGIVADSVELKQAVEQFSDYIAAETLALSINSEPLSGVQYRETTIGAERVHLYIKRATH